MVEATRCGCGDAGFAGDRGREATVSNEEYQEIQSRIALVATLTRGLPLNEFIAAAETASAVGPIIDPTLYIQGGKKLEAITELARSLRAFQATEERIRPVFMEPTVASGRVN